MFDCSFPIKNVSAALTWEDFLKQKWGSRLTDSRATLINRGLVTFYGVCSTALAFAAQPLGGIVDAATNMMGLIAGSLLGLFLLGLLVPRANRHGALLGNSCC